MTTQLRHVLDAHQFTPEFMEALFRRADQLRPDPSRGETMAEWRRRMRTGPLRDHLMYSLFFEPSTRTRFSLETAAKLLGMDVLSSENAGEFSSRAKGESDEDAIKVLSSYHPDVLGIRHDEAGSLVGIANVSAAPIINSGDGGGQHPTQALLDMYTIQREVKRLDSLVFLMGGDLAKGRTVHSLSYLVAKYPRNRIIFVAPPGLEVKSGIKEYLVLHGVEYVESVDLDGALAQADVVYWTRIQRERDVEGGMTYQEYRRAALMFQITPREMARMKPRAILMHPLPRVKEGFVNPKTGEQLIAELTVECDQDSRAAYFRQAQNGLYVRAALLEWVLGVGG